MASHACLRAEEALEKLLKPFSPLIPFSHVTEALQYPSKLDQGVDLCLKHFFVYFLPGWTGFNPYQLLDQLHQEGERAEPGTDST